MKGFELKEKHVSQQVKDFLEWQGWRLVRNNVTKLRDYAGHWTSYGEVGMPDFLALYYCQHDHPGVAVALWVEVKKADGKLSPQQVVWHTAELARGGCVVVASHFEDFEKWYWEHFLWLHHTQGQQPSLFPS